MPRSRPTYLYAIASVALVLFMLGFFELTILHAQKLVTLFKEKVDVWLELKPDVPQEDIARIIGTLRSEPFIKAETVTFITRDQAAASMREDLGDASLLEDMPNLMRDVVRFNVRADFFREDSLRAWRESLRQDTMIAELYVEAVNTGNIGSNIEKLGWFTLGLGILLIFAAVTLIHNTIRLALYTNRFLIKNQELVGASWGFISKPYILRGLFNGFWSALLAIAMLSGLLMWAQHEVPDLSDLQDINTTLAVFTGLILLGILISGLSSYFVVHKFLKMRIDDLY